MTAIRTDVIPFGKARMKHFMSIQPRTEHERRYCPLSMNSHLEGYSSRNQDLSSVYIENIENSHYQISSLKKAIVEELLEKKNP